MDTTELKALAEAATPGPWETRRETDDERRHQELLLEKMLAAAPRPVSAPALHAAGDIDLSHVIRWLENGCDPKEAAKELRLLADSRPAATHAGLMHEAANALAASVVAVPEAKVHNEIESPEGSFNWAEINGWNACRAAMLAKQSDPQYSGPYPLIVEPTSAPDLSASFEGWKAAGAAQMNGGSEP